MILSDAHDTVICTMDHLAVANLLADKKELALKVSTARVSKLHVFAQESI